MTTNKDAIRFLDLLVRLLREELQLLQEPGSYIGEVVKVMGKKKVLVKVQPEGKYGQSPATFASQADRSVLTRKSSSLNFTRSRRLFQ